MVRETHHDARAHRIELARAINDGGLTSGTGATATGSETSLSLTDIGSGADMVVIMFDAVSNNTTGRAHCPRITLNNTTALQAGALTVDSTADAGFDIEDVTDPTESYVPTDPAGNILDFCFKTDGTKMYVLDTSSETVYQYALSTAWDITTASYDTGEDYSANTGNSSDIMRWKPDGTILYICDSDEVRKHTLTTAWDLQSASYTSEHDFSSEISFGISSMEFSVKGDKLFLSDAETYTYTLSTPWDVATASYDGASTDWANPGQGTSTNPGRFSEDGRRWYSMSEETADPPGIVAKTIGQFSLTTPFDLSTASAVSESDLDIDALGYADTSSFIVRDDFTNVWLINKAATRTIIQLDGPGDGTFTTVSRVIDGTGAVYLASRGSLPNTWNTGQTLHGQIILTRMYDDVWLASGTSHDLNDTEITLISGRFTLSQDLASITVDTLGGTATFDSGSRFELLYL